jgi:hypothetical protein
MKKFGYLDTGPSDSEALYTEDAVIFALAKVQEFAGLRSTGKIDNETLEVCNYLGFNQRTVIRSRSYKTYILR